MQRRAWWRKRVALDLRMAALLAHLDTRWLGPWRCVPLHARSAPPSLLSCFSAVEAML